MDLSMHEQRRLRQYLNVDLFSHPRLRQRIRPGNNIRRRWHLALLSIYCARAFIAFLRPAFLGRSKSYTVLQIDDSDSESLNHNHTIQDYFPSIDKETLTSITQGKDLVSLSELGGVEDLVSLLKTNIAYGLRNNNPEDLLIRKTVFGSNDVFQNPPKQSLFSLIIAALKGIPTIIQVFYVVFCLGFGIKHHGYQHGLLYDGASIFIPVFLTLIIAIIINFNHNQVLSYLSSKINDIQVVVKVLRDGHYQEISILEIVVGDVLFLRAGDYVPADGIYLDGFSLKMTLPKTDGISSHDDVQELDKIKNPFFISGAKVIDGYGRMLVTSVGIKAPVDQGIHDQRNLLPAQLKNLASCIIKVGIIVAAILLTVFLIFFFTEKTKDERGNQGFHGKKMESNDVKGAVIMKIISAVVTIILVAMPEGIPLAVTLALSYFIKMMTNHGILVRKRLRLENVGSVTAICTGKTGILTLGKMYVSEFWVGREKIIAPRENVDFYVLELLREAFGLNTSGSAYHSEYRSSHETFGSSFENAILKWGFDKLELNIEKLHSNFMVLNVSAFNSEQQQSKVITREYESNTVKVRCKGAAEVLLGMCSNYYDKTGKLIKMSDEERKNIRWITQKMGAKGQTCIAFAEKQIEGDTDAIMHIERGLTLLGIVGLKHPPIENGIREAVKSCRDSGVRVKLVTSDSISTAITIGMECGILYPINKLHESVIEGVEFRRYTDQKKLEVVDQIQVIANASPEDKILMVQCLKRRGHVVAIVDEKNDISAVKEADIGVSMGSHCTLVNDSSDIIVPGGNFESIVTVLRWGRCMFNNIQKIIQVQLTIIAVGYVVSFIVAITTGQVPLLWVNMMVDTYMVALALATEQTADDIDHMIKTPPIRRSDQRGIVTKVIWRNVICQTVYQVAVLLMIQFKGKAIFGVDDGVRNTLMFNCFVLCQVFNEFNARKMLKKNIFEGIFKNRIFWGVVGITIALQIALVELLGKFTNTERLTWGQWGACVAVAALSWSIACFAKCVSSRM